MRNKAIWYGLVMIMVVIGWVSGMLIQAARIEAQELNTVQNLWAKQCDGDRVIVNKDLLVRCVEDVSTPRPTPTRAPTEKPLDIEPRQTANPCGDDPNYWTSCPPTEVPKP